jgi:hypothetical protein
MIKTLLTAVLFCGAPYAHIASAASEPWQKLPPVEQQALAPIYMQWNSLPEKQQQHLRHLAQHYPKLNTAEKERFSSRLATWANLTPAQRQAAREKYRAFSQVPIEKREQVKKMLLQAKEQPASAVLPAALITPAPAQP